MSKSKKSLIAMLLCLVTIFANPVQTLYASSPISFIILTKYSAVVDIGDQFRIIALPSNGKLPTWKSSNSSIASVNTYGLVTAKRSGTVTITAKIKRAEASCKVTVNKTKITLSTTNAAIERGQSIKLSATTSNNSKVIWKCNKKSIATIDENGTVVGIKPGEATITATADRSTSTCKIKVKSPTIVLNKTNIKLYRNQKCKLSATVSSRINPIWKTDKKSIAIVDAYGNITAIKNGTATITASVDGVSKSCKVTVEKPTIKLSSTKLNVKVGATVNLTANVSSGITPVWTSSNSNVVEVDSKGTITALKKGTAYIYASEDGTKARCMIKVT